MTSLVTIDEDEALRDRLAGHGMEVVGAAGRLRAGMDLVTHAEPDVALVDIRLPDGNGIDLMRALLGRCPELGLILCTSKSDADLLYRGMDSGARGYALENGSMAELVGAIERIAEGSSYVDPRLDRILLSPRATAPVPHLSPREREIMHVMARGTLSKKSLLRSGAIGARTGSRVRFGVGFGR